MKFIILGDTHLGARGGSNHFSDYFNRFYLEVLYPYMESNGIDTIVQLGDLFDSRTALSYKAYHRCKSVWFDELKQRGFRMITLLGNHDIHYRNTLEINSPELLLSDNENIQIITSPTDISLGGKTFGVVPWICESNREEINAYLETTNADVLFGHLELSGFPMSRGIQPHLGGENPKVFDRFSLVFSGHYHTHSQKGNIIYTGIPYEMTWADYGDQKGFFVFDTETNKYEFVENPLKMYIKLNWNNGCAFDVKNVKGMVTRVLVQQKDDPIEFEKFISSIKTNQPYDLTIIEGSISTETEIDETISIEDTASIITSYVNGLDINQDKNSITSYLLTLLHEAQTLDD